MQILGQMGTQLEWTKAVDTSDCVSALISFWLLCSPTSPSYLKRDLFIPSVKKKKRKERIKRKEKKEKKKNNKRKEKNLQEVLCYWDYTNGFLKLVLTNEWITISLGRILRFSNHQEFEIYKIQVSLLWSSYFVFLLIFQCHESFRINTTKGVAMLYWSYKIIVNWKKNKTGQKNNNTD